MPPDLRRELIATELPAHPVDRVYRPQTHEESNEPAQGEMGEVAQADHGASSLAPVDQPVRVDNDGRNDPTLRLARRRRATSQKWMFGVIAASFTFIVIVVLATKPPRGRENVASGNAASPPNAVDKARTEPIARARTIATTAPRVATSTSAASSASQGPAERAPGAPEDHATQRKPPALPRTTPSRPEGPRPGASSVRAVPAAPDVDAPLFPTSKN